ncbi:hypothetical protein KI809_09960 [Geobacter pelophilus]|uniref:Uncharacterized protein n=1 Tax=Geoanaerobacter pelophilus TaxID=60036 RepID=A0AAW4L340_9BACT|nr:hypothetical protein [Geoanaerobacter pelophilus]MBT0664622.1 hypothetical protein [Geoanaerobacter pelophilus]
MKYHPVIINGKNLSVIEDTYLLAALMTFEPSITCTPFWNEKGKVAFEVAGPISEGMRRYFSGEQASLAIYTSKLKYLRASIFAMKQSSVSYQAGLHGSLNSSFA